MTAIYDRRSGQTHLVAAPVPAILAALADRAAITPDELAPHRDDLLAIGLVARA